MDVWSDATWADDVDNKKSTSAYFFCVGTTLVAWSSKKQLCTAQSSCEMEYIGELITAMNAVWLLKLLFELKIKGVERGYFISVYVDNNKAIDIVKHEQYQKKIKYIILHYHYIRNLIKKG